MIKRGNHSDDDTDSYADHDPALPANPPAHGVCVVIPTHLRAELLRNAIRSVVAQTLPAAEILVVSDCPDAEALSICTESAAQGLRIGFVEHCGDGRGPSATRNQGVNLTSQPIIAFLDDDDWWAETYLEGAVGKLNSERSDIVVTWMLQSNGQRHSLGPAIQPGLTAQDVIAMNRGTTGSNVLLTREAFLTAGGYDQELQNKEDTDLFYRLLRNGFSYSVVTERLVFQRMHNGARLTDDTEERARDQERYLHKHRDVLRLRDRREIHRTIHRIRSRSSRSALERVGHRFAQLLNTPPRAIAALLVPQLRAKHPDESLSDSFGGLTSRPEQISS